MSGFMNGGPGVQLSGLNVDLTTYFGQVFVSPSVEWELSASCNQ